jgi:hypothetical protein
MTTDQLQLLKDKLNSDFVPALPPLIPNQCSEPDNQKKNTSRALSAFAIHHICSCSMSDASQAVVDDYNDNGIDAIYYASETNTLFIVQSKLKANEDFNQAEAITFCSGISDFLNQRYENFNAHVQSRESELDNSLTEAHSIVILIAHTSSHISSHAKDKIDTLIADPSSDGRLSASWVDYGPALILEDLTSQHSHQPIRETIELENAGKSASTIPTYYGELPISKFIELHQTYDKRLFHKNIRFFLGTKSDINKGIQKTLSETPENFFCFNNGITIVASNVREAGNPESTRRLELTDLSIINGAQTVASSASLIERQPDLDIDSARVLVTVIESEAGSDFSEHVTKNRNYQNAVNKAAFAALDSQQERLRKECAMYEITYLYRTEQNFNVRIEGYIGIIEAAYALASIKNNPNYPFKLKRNSSLFLTKDSDEYKKLFNEELSALQLINTVYLYRAAENILAAAERGESGRDKLIIKHGRFVIISLMFHSNPSLVSRSEIITYYEALDLVSPLLDTIRQSVIDHTNNRLDQTLRGPLFFFRSESESRDCILALRS